MHERQPIERTHEFELTMSHSQTRIDYYSTQLSTATLRITSEISRSD